MSKSVTRRLMVQLRGKTKEELTELLAVCQRESFQIRDMYNRLLMEVHHLKETARSGEELDAGIYLIVKAFDPYD